MPFLSLIRFPNLLIVVLTQFLVYYRLLEPALRQAGIRPVFDLVHLALLSLVTALITAVGYLINDMLDYAIDRVNRPDRIVLGRHISFQIAYWVTFVFTFLGFILALYLAFYVQNLPLLFLYPLALGGLYFYSAFWKRQAFIGNLAIALYCAGAAGVVWLAEQPALTLLSRSQPDAAYRIWSLFNWYLVFAFLITLFRELIKDMEDIEGDRGGQCRTLPIVWGERRAKALAIAFGLGLLGFLGGYGYFFQDQLGVRALAYMGAAVAAPLIIALVLLGKARTERAYHRLSQWIKFIILTGLLLLLFV